MNYVAQKAGLSQQMVSYVEREMRTPTLDTLVRITEVLEIDLGKLISKTRSRRNSSPAIKAKPTKN